MQTLLHGAMGGLLGALAGVDMVSIAAAGGRALLASPPDSIALLTVILSMSAWMAVGAGLSGFLFIKCAAH